MSIVNISRVSNIGNPYGGLLIGINEETKEYMWAIEDQCMGTEWEKISKFTYTVLLRKVPRNERGVYRK